MERKSAYTVSDSDVDSDYSENEYDSDEEKESENESDEENNSDSYSEAYESNDEKDQSSESESEKSDESDDATPYHTESDGSDDEDPVYEGDIIIERFYSDGKIKQKKIYKNGLKDGLSLKWDEEGCLEQSISYKEGDFHGEYKCWDGSILTTDCNYLDGHLHGKYTIYDDPIIEANYNMGDQEGPRTVYYIDEKDNKAGIKSRLFFIKGKREGEAVKYDKEGTLILTENYKNDQLHGESYQIRDGYQISTSYYEGQKHGREIVINPEGEVITDLTFEHGRMVGPGKETKNNNDDEKTETHYMDGQRHGLFRRWHQDSNELFKTANYYMGLLHGAVNEYCRNGEIFMWQYKMGQEHGTFKHYKEDGKIHCISYKNMGKFEGEHRKCVKKCLMGRKRDFYVTGDIMPIILRQYYINGIIWQGHHKDCKWSLSTKRIFLRFKRNAIRQVRTKARIRMATALMLSRGKENMITRSLANHIAIFVM